MSRPRLFKVLFVLSLLLNLVLLTLVSQERHQVRRIVSRLISASGLRSEPAPELMTRIKASVLGEAKQTPTQQIDAARDFVYTRSIHKIDAEHDRYAFDTPLVLEKLLANHELGAAAPHLSCGPRTFAMRAILNELGFRNRVLSVFSDDFEEFRSHTFLEVLNPETGHWEVHDPDYNVYYVSSAGKRLNGTRLVLGKLGQVEPRTTDPGKKGWGATGTEKLRDHYFEALMFYRVPEHRRSLILVNTDRFDPTDFLEFSRRVYGDPEILTQPGWLD